jgi:hypothetical protein
MASRVHDAILAVVAALQAGTTAALATVVDGPVLSGDDPPAAVFVGYDGDPAGDMHSTEDWAQQWAGLGAQRKDESFTVVCAVVSWSGDDDAATRRAAALAVLAAVEDDLRDPLNRGLGLPQPTVAMLASGQLFQEPTNSGLQARIPFAITVQTRI